jgi:hypothetical protein
MLSWSMSVRDYCERSGPGFWAEPVNALSNVAFLLAAVIAFRRWRHVGGNDLASLGLIAVVAAGGLGSFGFHALATLGAAVLDVGSIAVFICSGIGSCDCWLGSLSASCLASWCCQPLHSVSPQWTSSTVRSVTFRRSPSWVWSASWHGRARAPRLPGRQPPWVAWRLQGSRNARGKLLGCC